MIGRTDSTVRGEREFERRPAMTGGGLKLLTLAAMLLVFAGIAMVDHAEKNQLATNNTGFYSSQNNRLATNNTQLNDSKEVFGPSSYLGTRANFYDNELATNPKPDSQASDKRANGASTSLAGAVGAGATAVSLASKNTEPKFKDSSSLRTPEQHRRLSRKRQKLYRKNAPVLARRNLVPRYIYVQQPATAVESRTIRSYATVYPRYKKRTTVLGTAGKIITAPVKLLLSPFKKKEYYE